MAVWIVDAQLGHDDVYPGRPKNDDPSVKDNWKNIAAATEFDPANPTGDSSDAMVGGNTLTDYTRGADFTTLDLIGRFIRIRYHDGASVVETTRKVTGTTATTITFDGVSLGAGPFNVYTYAVGGAFASLGKSRSVSVNGDSVHHRGVLLEDVNFTGVLLNEFKAWDGAHKINTTATNSTIVNSSTSGLVVSQNNNTANNAALLGNSDADRFITANNCHIITPLGGFWDYTGYINCSAREFLAIDVGRGATSPWEIKNCTCMSFQGGLPYPPRSAAVYVIANGILGSIQDNVFRASARITGNNYLIKIGNGDTGSPGGDPAIDYNAYIVPDPASVGGDSNLIILSNATIITTAQASWNNWVSTHQNDHLFFESSTQTPWSPVPGYTNTWYAPPGGGMVDPDRGLGAPRPDAPWRNTASHGGPRGAFSVSHRGAGANGIQFNSVNTRSIGGAALDVTRLDAEGVITADPNDTTNTELIAEWPSQAMAATDIEGENSAGRGPFRKNGPTQAGSVVCFDLGAEVPIIRIDMGGLVEYATSRFDATSDTDATDNMVEIEGYKQANFENTNDPITPDIPPTAFPRFVQFARTTPVRYIRFTKIRITRD